MKEVTIQTEIKSLKNRHAVIWKIVTRMVLYLFTDALITAINKDIEQANEKLDLPVNQVYKEDNFFVSSANKTL